MSYNTAHLPAAIRQQAEDFIEFLLQRHQPFQGTDSSSTEEAAANVSELKQIVSAYQALPTLDDRSPEAMLYDEQGLPKNRTEP